MAVAFPAESADDRRTLPFGAAADARTNGRPVVFTPAPNAVVIVAGCWNCPTIDDRTFRWVSTDNGTSFTPPVQIGMGLETQGAGTWLDDVGIFVGASFSRVKASFLATPGIGVEYASGGLFAYGPEVTRVPASNKLVAVTNDLDVVKYGVYTGSSLTVANINNAANWLSDRTFVSAEADNSETAVNSGPNGVYVSYQYFVPNDTRVGLRRFDPATDSFGAPVYVEGDDPIDNDGLDYSDSFQEPSRRLHVVRRSLCGGGRLRYRVSDPSGAAFSVAANLATKESFFGTDVAAGAAARASRSGPRTPRTATCASSRSTRRLSRSPRRPVAVAVVAVPRRPDPAAGAAGAPACP